MKEYIERAAAITRFTFEQGDYIPEKLIDGHDNVIAVRTIKRVLRDIPTADVVEVVRCRDCKHITVGNIIRGQIYPACRKYKIMVGEDFFCADGERRETTHD